MHVPPRFLIVDDDHHFVHALRRAVEPHGVVEVAADLPTGRRAIAGQPSAVLLDVHVGRDDGIALLEELRAAGNEIPVLVITGDDDSRIVNRVQLLRAEIAHKPDVTANATAFCRGIVERSCRAHAGLQKWVRELALAHRLTKREEQVVMAAFDHRTHQDIADALGMAAATAKRHFVNALAKTGHISRDALVIEALEKAAGLR